MDRARKLRQAPVPTDGLCVVYVMSRDIRFNDNHALALAQQKALELKLPLVVYFNLLPTTGHRRREQYRFMLDGLIEVASQLQKHNISFVLRSGPAIQCFKSFYKQAKPACVVFDFSPLAGPQKIRKAIAKNHPVPCYEVDTHNIIPAWIASDHQEFAAHTFRPKVHRMIRQFLNEPSAIKRHPYRLSTNVQSDTFEHANSTINSLPQNQTLLAYKPGESAAHNHLKSFLNYRLVRYAIDRNNPNTEGQSDLSPYLHFGNLSALRVVLSTLSHVGIEPLLFSQTKLAQSSGKPSDEEGMNALLEELIVRKELADNFCLYAKSYTNFSSIPAWARATLNKHRLDVRTITYSRSQWEDAQTHDPAWNAAQKELTSTGKMHGYMRMYWAKKILEWSASPEQALEDCLYLNDTYSIDGGDPNGYVGILWSIAGLHDRPWFERPVYGQIRYMNSDGLKRKFDLSAYIKRFS